MKKLFAFLFVATFTCSLLLAEGAEKSSKGKKLSCEERERHCMQKRADYYRKTAESYKKSKLSSCEQKADAAIKEAAEKVAAMKKDMAAKYDELASAYEKGDKRAISKLENAKRDLENKLCIAEKQKCLSYSLNSINKAVEKYPNSQELKNLQQNAKAEAQEYISLMKQKNEIESKCRELDKNMDKMHKLIEIAKHKEKLKKLQSELNK
jgi:hypothetical protein